MNYFLYSILIALLLPFILLYLVIRSRKDRRYRQHLLERLGIIHNDLLDHIRGAIVVHAASVGEVEASVPLVSELLARYPNVPLVMTCTTTTGRERISKHFADRVSVCYLPVDWELGVRFWLARLKPRAVILLETELWPNLINQCFKLTIPTLLVNARLSARSAAGYRRFSKLTRIMLQQLSFIGAQNKATLRRFRALGFLGKGQVCGNLKFDFAVPADKTERGINLRKQLPERRIWVAGSTHAGEDEVLLKTYVELRQHFADLLLVLVPRHPERFEPVAQLILEQGLSLARFSQLPEDLSKANVFLGDTMGDMLMWYELADFIFIGGSLIERGGHNPLEAIRFAKPIMTGPHYFNFKDTFNALLKSSAAIEVNQQTLLPKFKYWLENIAEATAVGKAGQAWFSQFFGASTLLANQVSVVLGDEQAELSYSISKHHTIVYQSSVFETIDADYLDEAFWQAQNAITGSASGRNPTWFIRYNSTEMLLRHYYRGGLVRHFIKRHFFGVSSAFSRSFSEFKLLLWMRVQGLAVPKPLVAKFSRNGITYEADILIEKIPSAQNVFSILQKRELLTEEWQRLGRVIAAMHRIGVNHTDLNCHNMMLDQEGQFWLIDFDKCRRQLGKQWMAANLARLKRSFLKEQTKHSPFFWSDQAWSWLIESYQQAMNHDPDENTQPVMRCIRTNAA